MAGKNAGISFSGKSHCPTCGATSTKPEIGRDGSPRWADPSRMPLSDDPTIARRREHARRLRMGQ